MKRASDKDAPLGVGDDASLQRAAGYLRSIRERDIHLFRAVVKLLRRFASRRYTKSGGIVCIYAASCASLNLFA